VAPLAILDVDGTLVDTNYHHALAWYRAFRQQGVVVPAWRIHRRIGMGGDRLVADMAGDEVERALGEEIRAAEKHLYLRMLHEVDTFPDARELIVELKGRKHAVVLASSAKEHEVDRYLDLLEARELVDGSTSSADVEDTKPAPDLVRAAMERGGQEDGAVLVGDSTWDCRAAARAGVPSIAMLTGGFSTEELEHAGASMVCESLVELRQRLDETPLGRSS
jgi:HAD superfamily hydrolase (TIGR01549 family)